MNSGLSVVIPSKTASNLFPCIRAVQNHEPAARIIVIDDGVDWEAEDSRELIAPVYRVQGIKPFVFARNVNLGIRAAGTDDMIVLNDDALLESPGGFTLLQKAAEQHPEYGIIGAASNNVGNPNQNRRTLNALREDPRMVCFTAVLIPRRTIETVGLLDERFTDYGCEDDDYCFRVRQAGFKIGIHDGCFVNHAAKGMRSSFRGPVGAGGDYRPNLRRFIAKHGVDNWGATREKSNFKQLFDAA